MEPKEMSKWAYSYACSKCHAGEPCELDQCINAQAVAEFLDKTQWVDTADRDGNALKGWFIPATV